MKTPSPDTAVMQHGEQPNVITALMQAVDSKDPRMLELILNAREKWQADESRAMFNRASVKFQQRVAIIPKLDKAYDKMYARTDRIWREIRPLLDECGLAVTWESVKTTDSGCVLDGHLRHIGGHAQPLHHEIPMPDLLKGQNAAQRAGSAETYAKRYALCAALGIQTGDDTDGHVELPAKASARAIADVRAALAANGRDEAKACAYLRLRTLDDATADDLIKLATTMAQPAKRATAPTEAAGAHVPTRAESLAIIAGAKEPKKSAALDQRDLTPANYANGNDEDLAHVAGLLRGE